MNIAQIENNLQNLIKNFSKDTFIFDLLLAYGLPKASITRLQNGNLNLSKVQGEVSWKKKVLFKPVENEDLHVAITKCKEETKQEQRFIIVTDFKTLLAVDTKTSDTLDIELENLPSHFDFFLPWAGMEKATHKNENPADVKAAEKMAKLFDEIKKDNPDNSPEFIHGLNVFLSRLLFCFFAEDTNIFKKGQFTNAISSHTQTDGSDLSNYLDKLFDVLNTHERNRKELPAYLSEFPYVNGGLFQHKHKTPTFTRRSRQAIIDAGELDWSAINPDIFGSMIQAVITPEHRGGLGMHYTSVPNIMKVIEPLFLNELNEEFVNGKYEPKKLNKLLERLGKIKIFDPACGSGNFLIIAYKELRFLEIKILLQLQELQKAATGFEPYQLELIPKAQLTLAAQYQQSLFSRIELAQFFGIELDDFAHEIAILSLWLAQHQMNQKFKEVLGESTPTLPLQAGGNIVHGNATRVDWEKVCPKKESDEIYILGNPPYIGAKLQNEEQRSDLAHVFSVIKDFKNFLEDTFKKQQCDPQPLVLFYIDLDDFRSMNDSLGYVIGDKIIKNVGSRLQEFLNPDDFLSRYAEDEFVVLMADPHDPKKVIATAEKILDLISQIFQVEGHTIHLSASIGIVTNNNSIQYSSELLSQSVLAMQEAKRHKSIED